MRQCTQCKRLGIGPKPLSEFCKGSGKDGLQNMCREHTREYNRAWAKKNPERNRAKGKKFRDLNPVAYRKISIRAGLRNRYGMTEDDFNRMFEAQKGCCSICGTKLISQLDETRAFHGHAPNEVARVDHDHKTGKVRGLLCFTCNVGLGKFRDNEVLLLSAVRYLRESATAQRDSRTQHDTLKGESGPESRDPYRTVSRGSRRDELSPFIN